ncbi:MAG: hypothetical protein IT210_12630 [Armatimonadetes bacterium]|nr:hypothetical protein [Armatimonadota bacterium]
MRKGICLIAVAAALLGLVGSRLLSAVEPEGPPRILDDGFAAYKAGGSHEAIRVWVKGGILEDQPEQLENLEKGLQSLEKVSGAYLTYHVAQVHLLAPTAHIVYVVADHAKGPVFCKFLLYRRPEGWSVVQCAFNTGPEQILPSGLQHH